MVYIVPAAALKKRQCLAKFFMSLASAAFFAKRERAAKDTIYTIPRGPLLS